MKYLESLLDTEYIDDIYEIYNEDFLSELDNDNVKRIVEYLKDNGVYYYSDIITNYLDLFILDYKEFINRFEKLKLEHTHLIELLGCKMDLLESMRE